MSPPASDALAQSRPSALEASLHETLRTLGQEIRKDIGFFAGTAFFVSLLELVHHALKRHGLAPQKSWSDALFSDYLSFDVFGFQMLCCMLIGSGAHLLRTFGVRLSWLDTMIEHVRQRLLQLASPILCFTFGLLPIALLHGLMTPNSKGIVFAAMVVVFDALIVLGCLAIPIASTVIHPTKQRMISLSLFLFAATAIGWITLFGPN